MVNGVLFSFLSDADILTSFPFLISPPSSRTADPSPDNNFSKKYIDTMSSNKDNSHQSHHERVDPYDDDQQQQQQQQRHYLQQGRPIAPIPRGAFSNTSNRPPALSPLSFSPSSFHSSSSSFSSSSFTFTSSLPSPPFPSSLPSLYCSTSYPFPPFSSSSSPPSPSPSDETEHPPSSCHSEVPHTFTSHSPSTATPQQQPTQLPMNLPLIGNGPGYKNGEAIALPILPTFNKKLTSGRTSVPASPTTATDPNGSTSRSLLAEAALIPSSLHPNDNQHPGAITTAGTTVAPAVTNGGLHTPATATSTCSGVAGQDNLRGGADAGILVFSGGTACNSLVQLLQDMTPNVTYVCKFFCQRVHSHF